MMKLTVPKNAVRKSNVFYVSSEAEPTKTYMVVKVLNVFVCQCNDFSGRKLPMATVVDGDSVMLRHCKHTEFVADVEHNSPTGVRVISAVRESYPSKYHVG